MQKENLVELSGTVETVVYKNEESGFAVLELDHGGELVTVVGELASVGEGEMLTLHGSFRTHPNYGTQFKAVAAQQRLPASASAILRYLSSGAIKGIGPVLASRMVAQFGNDTLQVLEHEPQRLREVKGITEAKCEKLRTELSRMFGMRAVMLFLSQFGVSSSTSVAIWKRWGTLSQKMIEENPYLLCCDEIGMDFDSCEMIARKLNIPPDSSYRIEAALQFVLRHNLYNGHTCLPVDKLLPTAERLLDQSCIMVEKGLEELLRRRREKQPLEYPSAGSFFKRPPGHFAGALIEGCGLKGFAVGGAQVSEKHAGFVVNRGGATAQDVLRLCEAVQRRILISNGSIQWLISTKPPDVLDSSLTLSVRHRKRRRLWNLL